tara:strand:+ start:1916 stop:2236 length:321 start_codon:yes stop_codon:yes gene_type:complete
MTTVNQQYRRLNPAGANPREISEVVNNLMDGKSNNVGYFSTVASSTSQIIYNERIGFDSAIVFTPLDANAATEMANLYVGSRSRGQAVIEHTSNAYICNFMYIVVG